MVGQPRGGVLARCEQSRVGLLAEVEQLPRQSLAEGERPLPAKGDQLLCSLGVDPSLMVLVCSCGWWTRGVWDMACDMASELAHCQIWV